MTETRAEVVVPVGDDEAYSAVTDLDHADWLPAVRRLRHLDGPSSGVGARYQVEVGLVGKHLEGILVCREAEPPRRLVLVLEDGLDLTVTVTVTTVSGGCRVELLARYSVGGGLLGAAIERATARAAQHEAERAVEALSARFGRKHPHAPLPTPVRRRRSA